MRFRLPYQGSFLHAGLAAMMVEWWWFHWRTA